VIERIDINVQESKLVENDAKRVRLAKTQRFEPTDRTPVIVDMQLWALLAGRGAHFSELLEGPRQHLRGQILNKKYRYETIQDDLPLDTEKLVVELDFGALRGVEFPMQVVFNGDDQPKTVHLLHEPQEIDHLTVPDPYSGHNKMRVDWYRAMLAAVEDFDVRLNGQPMQLEVNLTHLGGPIPSAFALCGSNLLLWIALDPERVHRLMEIVTQSHMNCLDYLDDLKGVSHNHAIWLGADTGEMMGRAHFKQFVLPYYQQIWEKYAYPRVFHMCGKIDHLIDLIRDELDITYLDGFGFPTDRRKLADGLAGRVVLRGGPHPSLIYDGPVEAIIAEGQDYLRTTGRRGGYILSEGFGIVAGTPPEHIEALVQASIESGPASLDSDTAPLEKDTAHQ
jgi:uroporphyrinogen-III decarboxylase